MYLFLKLAIVLTNISVAAEVPRPTANQLDDFREELLIQRKSTGFNQTVVGREIEVIDSLNISARQAHVVNVAGADDILRMVYDFPLATHYHIVDWMEDIWTDSEIRIETLHDFFDNLAHIGDKVSVKIIRSGFLRHYPQENFAQLVRSDARYREPVIVGLEWTSPALGQMRKLFYFHPNSFKDKAELSEVLSSIPNAEPIIGIFLHGIGRSRGWSKKRIQEESTRRPLTLAGVWTQRGYGSFFESPFHKRNFEILGNRLYGAVHDFRERVESFIEILEEVGRHGQGGIYQGFSFEVSDLFKENQFLFESPYKISVKWEAIKEPMTGRSLGAGGVTIEYHPRELSTSLSEFLGSSGEIFGLTVQEPAPIAPLLESYLLPLLNRLVSGGAYVTIEQDDPTYRDEVSALLSPNFKIQSPISCTDLLLGQVREENTLIFVKGTNSGI